MKKNFKFYVSVWAVLLAVFNVAAFVSPAKLGGFSKFGGAFWTGYIFITIAFLGQLLASYFAFKAENLEKLFYKLPLINISWTGLVLTLVFGILAMAIPDLPSWIGIIVCFAVLAFTCIALIKAFFAGNVVEQIDSRVKSKTDFIKSITAEAENLLSGVKELQIKSEVKAVYEALRYSDPMSDAALVETEKKIEDTFCDFKNAVNEEDKELCGSVSKDLLSLIDMRNRKCKLLK